MNLRFAFAVNNDNLFQKKHFGDADKYLIYRYNSSEMLEYMLSAVLFID